MADPTNNLSSVLCTLNTLAQLGPVGVADRAFAETASEVLSRVMRLVRAHEGALLCFDETSRRMQCAASAGLDRMPAGSLFALSEQSSVQWQRGQEILRPDAEHLTALFERGPRPKIECIIPLHAFGRFIGALCLGSREAQAAYGDHQIEALEVLRPHVTMIVQNQLLRESLRVQVADNVKLLGSLQHCYDDALEALATTIDAVDENMRGHSTRVGKYSAGIARTLGMSDSQVLGARAAAQMHDIGRVTVDKSIHAKPGSLRAEEFRIMADHTVFGHQIVSSVRFPWAEIPDAVRWHHERADGSGYPDKLRESEMPMVARIVAVADSFDAMLSERPYRPARSFGQAAQELVQLAPVKFDPNVVLALLAYMHETAAPLHGERVGSPELAIHLDSLSASLMRKITGGRVYSA